MGGHLVDAIGAPPQPISRAKLSNHGKESPRGFTLDHTIPKSQFASCTEYTTRKLALRISSTQVYTAYPSSVHLRCVCGTRVFGTPQRDRLQTPQAEATSLLDEISVLLGETPRVSPERDTPAASPAREAREASPEAREASPEARAALPEARAASPEARCASPEVCWEPIARIEGGREHVFQTAPNTLLTSQSFGDSGFAQCV